MNNRLVVYMHMDSSQLLTVGSNGVGELMHGSWYKRSPHVWGMRLGFITSAWWVLHFGDADVEFWGVASSHLQV